MPGNADISGAGKGGDIAFFGRQKIAERISYTTGMRTEKAACVRAAEKIVARLQKRGFEAYLAGGAVRDMLLGREPQDADVATSAKPEEVRKIFRRVVPVGEEFGVVEVLDFGVPIEVATFREDVGVRNHRHPRRVRFAGAEADARRRDFTINALFYDPRTRRVLDFVGGQRDLRRRRLRFVGKPRERINEDALRIMRAVRLKNTLGLRYAWGVRRALCKGAPLLTNISGERIRDELDRMWLSSAREEALADMDRLGILAVVLPELAAMHGVKQPRNFHAEGDVWRHTRLCLRALPSSASLTLVWATLLHDVGKPPTAKIREGRWTFYEHQKVGGEMAEQILRRLRYPRRFIDTVRWLVEHHLVLLNFFDMREGRRRTWMTHEHFPLLLALLRADGLGSRPQRDDIWRKVNEIYQRFRREVPRVPKPLLDGHEIMRLRGWRPGPRVGKLKAALLEAQLEGRVKTRRQAEEFVRAWEEAEKERK
jgi:poly(A) polymerase